MWLILWAAFFMVGMLIRQSVSADFNYELYGYDYGKYTVYFASYCFITYMPFRHPLLGLFSAPLINFGAQIVRISPQTYFVLLHAVFAGLGTLAAWLVKEIGGWIAVCVFLTIPFVWLVAAVPESYAISMCVLLGVVWWVKNQERHGKNPFVIVIVWVALFAVAGGVTLTNGLKVAIAYVVVNRLSRRQWKWFAIASLAILLIGIVFFGLRMHIWNMAHPEAQKSISHSMEATLRWMNNGMSVTEWARAVVRNFFFFPLTMGRRLAMLWAVLVYLTAAFGIWVARKERIVHVMGGMFAVDVVIHIVCGWALEEAWIFSPHWIWMVPILAGSAIRYKVAEK